MVYGGQVNIGVRPRLSLLSFSFFSTGRNRLVPNLVTETGVLGSLLHVHDDLGESKGTRNVPVGFWDFGSIILSHL